MYYLTQFSISVSFEQELFPKFGGTKKPLHTVAFNIVFFNSFTLLVMFLQLLKTLLDTTICNFFPQHNPQCYVNLLHCIAISVVTAIQMFFLPQKEQRNAQCEIRPSIMAGEAPQCYA
jgi:hypothetical protein